MILEKLSNKVNPKRNIYRPTWKLETDKIRNMGTENRRMWRRGRGRKKGRVEENLRNGIVE